MKILDTLLICAFICALTACKPCENIITEVEGNERIETRREVVYLPDTILVEIPAQVSEKQTRDSTSHLETDFAESDARIMPDGSLFHRLANKEQMKPTPTQKPVEYRDSIIEREKKIKVPYAVEKKLTRWQEIKLDTWGWLLVALLLSLGWNFKKPLMSLIRRFI